MASRKSRKTATRPASEPETAPQATNAPVVEETPAPAPANPDAALAILDQAIAEATPAPAPAPMSSTPPGQTADIPRRGRKPKSEGLSMTPEAIRMRERRARNAGGQTATGERFTPSVARPAAAAPVLQTGDVAGATRAVKGFIRAMGFLASLFLKDEDMEVAEQDAQTTAELILAGWPELAHSDSSEMKKFVAVMAVAGVVGEKYKVHQKNRVRQGRAPVKVVSAPRTESAMATDSVLSMRPDTL